VTDVPPDDDTEHDVPSERTEATKREGGSERPKPRSKDAPPTPPNHLQRGALVGRYVILDVLGEGGMGVVYNAFDPELDRKIAIKLLQAGEGESTGQAWLLREAQALARLSHPNVVAVHDVGTLANDRVFVAMELVAGGTMRDWLREPRTWREVVGVMLAAGTGLAAAHAAGLVHRDFKPDNVIVGDDGRVRVMDFGLARLRPDEDQPASRDSDLRIEARSPLSEQLTVAGTVIGTPAYMAPEIHSGGAADARADQFAFGVAFYEALFLSRPYSREQLKSGLPVKPRVPDDLNKVPAQIRRVVMRAISIAPAERYPSMDALLAELAIDPMRRRRRVLIGLGAAAVIGGAVAGTYLLGGSHEVQPSELCSGGTRRLEGVWDDAARAKVKAAFERTKLSFADKSFETLAQAIDGYASSWTQAATENCEATRLRGEQTEDVMTLRQGCLDQRLAELRAFVQILGDEPGRPLVEKGDRAVFELEPLARCSNVAALREPGTPPPEVRATLGDLIPMLAEAKAQIIAGRYVQAILLANKALERARKASWKPLLSEVEGIRGSALMTSGQFDAAAEAFADATWMALEGRRDDLVAGAAFSSAMVVASGLGKPGEAKVWLALADSAARRIGKDQQMDLRRSQVRGIVLAESGDLLGAVAAHEQTFKIASLLYGKDNPGLFADEIMYATTLTKAYQFASAIPHFEHAIKLRTSTVGNEHPDIAMMMSNLGIAYRRTRADKRAHEAFDHALAIRERVYGKNSPLLVATLDNMADLYEQEGDFPHALAVIERAAHLSEVIPGKDHPTWHQIATDQAEVLTSAGMYKEAGELFDEILMLEEKTHSTILPVTQTSRAELALAEHAWEQARTFAKLGVAGFEAAGGPNNPELVRALTALGRAQVELHDADAKATLERAAAIAAHTELAPPDLADLHTALARVRGK